MATIRIVPPVHMPQMAGATPRPTGYQSPAAPWAVVPSSPVVVVAAPGAHDTGVRLASPARPRSSSHCMVMGAQVQRPQAVLATTPYPNCGARAASPATLALRATCTVPVAASPCGSVVAPVAAQPQPQPIRFTSAELRSASPAFVASGCVRSPARPLSSGPATAKNVAIGCAPSSRGASHGSVATHVQSGTVRWPNGAAALPPRCPPFAAAALPPRCPPFARCPSLTLRHGVKAVLRPPRRECHPVVARFATVGARSPVQSTRPSPRLAYRRARSPDFGAGIPVSGPFQMRVNHRRPQSPAAVLGSAEGKMARQASEEVLGSAPDEAVSFLQNLQEDLPLRGSFDKSITVGTSPDVLVVATADSVEGRPMGTEIDTQAIMPSVVPVATSEDVPREGATQLPDCSLHVEPAKAREEIFGQEITMNFKAEPPCVGDASPPSTADCSPVKAAVCSGANHGAEEATAADPFARAFSDTESSDPTFGNSDSDKFPSGQSSDDVTPESDSKVCSGAGDETVTGESLQPGDVVRLGNGAPPELRGQRGIVTKVAEKHCTVVVLDDDLRLVVGECWPNFADIYEVQRNFGRLGTHVLVDGLKGQRTKVCNGHTGIVVAHRREGHPCFITKPCMPDQPILVLCIRFDDPPSSDLKEVLVEVRFTRPSVPASS